MIKAILLVSVSIFTLSSNAQSLLPEYDNADVVFYGEMHSSQQHLDPILDSLEEGIISGKINTFATEYLPYDLNTDFQNFLNSPTAISGSEEGASFFSKV